MSEYRMIRRPNGPWMKVKLADQKRNVMVNVKGYAPFVISRQDWDAACACSEDRPEDVE